MACATFPQSSIVSLMGSLLAEMSMHVWRGLL